MIVELGVENLAIIERSQLCLGPGFTVLTGETGAGKSLLIDAIELALGERADTDLVRTGAAKASVTLVFDLSQCPAGAVRCQEFGFELEEGRLIVHREVLAEGRSQCRVGGRPASVSALRQLGVHLVDLHGQHDHQSLMHPERHLGFLDDWIGEPARTLLDGVRDAYVRLSEAKALLDSLRRGLRDREHRLDLLRFQIGEIEAVAPRAGELEELETQLARLRNVERLSQASALALTLLAGEDGSAVERIGAAVKHLEESVRLDPSLEPLLEPLRSSLYTLEEGVLEVSRYADSLEADPQRLEEVAARCDALRRLRRKYGDCEEAVLQFLHGAMVELDLLADAESNEQDLEERVGRIAEEL
jgi:DNA repair protein RecN (Recombination protein N)